MDRIEKLQQLVQAADTLHINSEWLDYIGVVEYYPEELVITVKAGTKITDIQSVLAEHHQALPFFTASDEMSIGAMYANGAPDLSDSVLGVQIINGNGELLNFGGQVMKNVAGYDVARLLVGSKGMLAVVTQISFKVMPKRYIDKLTPHQPSQTSALYQAIEKKLKQVFDPKGVFN